MRFIKNFKLYNQLPFRLFHELFWKQLEEFIQSFGLIFYKYEVHVLYRYSTGLLPLKELLCALCARNNQHRQSLTFTRKKHVSSHFVNRRFMEVLVIIIRESCLQYHFVARNNPLVVVYVSLKTTQQYFSCLTDTYVKNGFLKYLYYPPYFKFTWRRLAIAFGCSDKSRGSVRSLL